MAHDKRLGDELRVSAERTVRERKEAERRREEERDARLRNEEAAAKITAPLDSEPIYQRCLEEARKAARASGKGIDVLIEETEQRNHFDRRGDDTPEYRQLVLKKFAGDEAARRLVNEGVQAVCKIDIWDDTERGGAEDYYPMNIKYRLVMKLTW